LLCSLLPTYLAPLYRQSNYRERELFELLFESSKLFLIYIALKYYEIFVTWEEKMKKIRSIITATATLILLSGCIERGHHLSVNQRVHRPTTTHNIGLHSGTKQAKKKLSSGHTKKGGIGEANQKQLSNTKKFSSVKERERSHITK